MFFSYIKFNLSISRYLDDSISRNLERSLSIYREKCPLCTAKRHFFVLREPPKLATILSPSRH
jgi:hypothetical protein